MKTLLLIDGGGARGVIPAKLLAHWRAEILRRTGARSFHITRAVDFLGGTSTGGLIVGALNTKSKFSTPLMDADDVLQMYRDELKNIFKKPPRVVRGLWSEIYNADNIEKVFEDVFGFATNKDNILPYILPTYDFYSERPFYFTQHTPRVLMSHALRATSSAPYLFRPTKFKDAQGREGYYIDGGINANNSPLISAIIEARNSVEGFEVNNFRIISIGTGYKPNPREFKRVNRAGALYWAKNITPLLLGSNTQLIEQWGEMLFGEGGVFPKVEYIRINPELRQASASIDDVTESQIEAMEQDALNDVFVSESAHERVIEILIENGSRNL